MALPLQSSCAPYPRKDFVEVMVVGVGSCCLGKHDVQRGVVVAAHLVDPAQVLGQG